MRAHQSTNVSFLGGSRPDEPILGSGRFSPRNVKVKQILPFRVHPSVSYALGLFRRRVVTISPCYSDVNAALQQYARVFLPRAPGGHLRLADLRDIHAAPSSLKRNNASQTTMYIPAEPLTGCTSYEPALGHQSWFLLGCPTRATELIWSDTAGRILCKDVQ